MCDKCKDFDDYMCEKNNEFNECYWDYMKCYEENKKVLVEQKKKVEEDRKNCIK